MQRVLSFQMTRNIGESSEYVTKRLCVSFLFSVGFLCLLCGFLLGRFVAERSMETQMQKTRDELAGNGLRKTEHLQQVALLELTKASFDYDTTSIGNLQTPDLIRDNVRKKNIRINEFFSNLSFVHEVINNKDYVRATIRGSRELDRYVMLWVNKNNISVALELAQVLDRIYSAHDWRPRRSLIFCVSLTFRKACVDSLPTFIQRKAVAYVSLDDQSRQTHVTLSGSDVIRSIAVEAVKTIPNGNWTYLDHDKMSIGPILLNIPQVTFSFMISQTMWRLSESIIIQWEPKYFNKTVNEVLELINSKKFQDVKETLKRTSRDLVTAVKDLNAKIDATEITQTLQIRIWNDLLLDLDKTLLCFDHSIALRIDELTALAQLESNETLNNLKKIAKCYEDAIQMLQEK
ncbi:uncharacterized protein LOC114942022 isoform X2 [Nylanderia fulva]|uniref:uncharacterized protein LOC114942022 isoform X2 n=1 Tax=Nylanderia fulva TaxID=613905 RepID=UPI0010FB9071|nr:uncharacterized protein LOC114942022 isoform X2 [Nylanderia fulva]